jgi:predicted RNase H-like HicB family nuclease
MLDIATQGRTEEEVKENMADLIEEYMEDPDTQNPRGYCNRFQRVRVKNT